MEFKNFVFQASRLVGHEKVWKIIVKIGNRLSLQMSEQKQNKIKASYQATLSGQLDTRTLAIARDFRNS